MDRRFSELASIPDAQIFSVVFFPDRVYHAEYLNATRSSRYRYNVQEVRGKSDAMVLKGEVYFDGLFLCNFMRIECRGARLVEVARERGRFVEGQIQAQVRVASATVAADARLTMTYCPWIDAYQVECWKTLEAPVGRRHDYQVLDMMGAGGSITTVPVFDQLLDDLGAIRWINLSFREGQFAYPSGFFISDLDAAWDNFYERNVQVPNTQAPSSDQNTVRESSYGVTFQRGWYFDNVRRMAPVRYRNAMMNNGAPGSGQNNIVEMRWVLQQELGGSLVFFHEVTVPVGVVEGTHQHVGSEELYYVVDGKGVAYLGFDDDPALANVPIVMRDIFGIGPKPCRAVPVEPGSVIFTKSGGIHGIENSGDSPLRFVAFLYHCA